MRCRTANIQKNVDFTQLINPRSPAHPWLSHTDNEIRISCDNHESNRFRRMPLALLLVLSNSGATEHNSGCKQERIRPIVKKMISIRKISTDGAKIRFFPKLRCRVVRKSTLSYDNRSRSQRNARGQASAAASSL